MSFLLSLFKINVNEGLIRRRWIFAEFSRRRPGKISQIHAWCRAAHLSDRSGKMTGPIIYPWFILKYRRNIIRLFPSGAWRVLKIIGHFEKGFRNIQLMSVFSKLTFSFCTVHNATRIYLYNDIYLSIDLSSLMLIAPLIIEHLNIRNIRALQRKRDRFNRAAKYV